MKNRPIDLRYLFVRSFFFWDVIIFLTILLRSFFCAHQTTTHWNERRGKRTFLLRYLLKHSERNKVSNPFCLFMREVYFFLFSGRYSYWHNLKACHFILVYFSYFSSSFFSRHNIALPRLWMHAFLCVLFSLYIYTCKAFNCLHHYAKCCRRRRTISFLFPMRAFNYTHTPITKQNNIYIKQCRHVWHIKYSFIILDKQWWNIYNSISSVNAD